MIEYVGIIYKYTSPSGKCYIGQTTRPAERKTEHVSQAYSGSQLAFHRAIRKYGISNFTYEVISSVRASSKKKLKESLDILESFYIKKYKSNGIGGYNLTCGGEGILGYSHSPITKSKLSVSHKGKTFSTETRKKMSSWQLGKKLSQSTKDKISKAHIGQATNKRKCYQYDGTILVGIYSSVKEASNYTGICKTAISSVLSGRRKTAGGFIWMKEKI